MTIIAHDGYLAAVELDEAAGFFRGEVINTRDMLTVQGSTPDALRATFAENTEDCIAWCAARGKAPERPYSGNFTIRLSPDRHRRVATVSARNRKSVSAFVAAALERAA